MPSLFSKVQTLISANLHSMVDKALKSNSVAVLDEYIRQAENNLEDLEDALITVRGQVKTLERKYKLFQAEADQLDNDIDRLLRAGKEELAMAAQVQYNSKADMAEQYREQYQGQKGEADKLGDARLKLEAKLTTGESQVMLALKSGKAIRFEEAKTRPMGRNASGVRGITLANDKDEVVGMISVNDMESDILVVTIFCHVSDK